MRKRKAKSKGKAVEVEPIKGYHSALYIHSYYQIDQANTNKMDSNLSAEDIPSIETSEYAMAMYLYFASTFHLATDIIFLRPLKEPPDGFTMALIMISITWICITPHLVCTCIRIMKFKGRKQKRPKSCKQSEKSTERRNSKKES